MEDQLRGIFLWQSIRWRQNSRAGGGFYIEWSPPSHPSILPSAGLKPVSNGMAPTLRLPSPTLKKGGRVCLLFWMVVRPVYHCHFTRKGGLGEWVAGEFRRTICPAPGFTTKGAPRGETPTLHQYISISAFRASTAFVSAHSGCQDVCLHC